MTLSPVITPAKAYMMTSLLRSVVTDGTARSLKNLGIDFPVAGKTGTTNNYKDAWFIGYTPDLLVLVWVGFDNGDPLDVGGAKAALPIFADLIKQVPHQMSLRGFPVPGGVVKRWVCLDPVKPYIFSQCNEPVEEVFLKQSASKPSFMPQNVPDEVADQKGP